jgi:hypothetical protein
MRSIRFACNAATLGLFCLVTLSSQARNLISNGSFEDNSGSFNAWNTVNNSGFLLIDDGTAMSTVPQDGSYFAVFAGSVADTIDQSFATTPGAGYNLNFWVNDKYGASDLVVQWDGTTLLHLDSSYITDSANNGWVNFDFPVTASSGFTDLAFSGSSVAAVGLDNVSVPDSGSLASFLGSVGGLLAFDSLTRRFRRHQAPSPA